MSQYRCQCSACGRVFDVQASLREREEGRSEKFACPQCRSEKVKPVFSPVNFIKNIFCGGRTESCCSGKDNCCDASDRDDPNGGKKDCCSDKTACGGDNEDSDGKDKGCRCDCH